MLEALRLGRLLLPLDHFGATRFGPDTGLLGVDALVTVRALLDYPGRRAYFTLASPAAPKRG